MRRTFLASFALLLGTTGTLSAQQQPVQSLPGRALAERFGALESIQDISLSPAGAQVAFLSHLRTGEQVLYVANLAGGSPRPIVRQSRERAETIRYCNWVTDTRLVCMISVVRDEAGTLVTFSRIIALNSDGSEIKMLSNDGNSRSLGAVYYGGSVIDWDLPGQPGRVLMIRDFVPEQSTGTSIHSDARGLGVEEVDTLSLSRRIVERPKSDASGYMTDGEGNVRVMGLIPHNSSGYIRGTITYLYRKADSREWERLAIGSLDDSGDTGFEPVAVDRRTNRVFAFDNNNGYAALFGVSLDGAGQRELLLSRPDVDVDELVRIGRDRRVVGASYATERRQVEYFDPELRSLTRALSRALPGQPAVSIVDANIGETKLLVFVSSDVDPGKFYLYDKGTHQLEEVLPVRSELAGLTMSEMRPVTFPAADGTQIPGYLTLPPGSDGRNLPAIVMPHGGPSSRDEWGFDWLVQYYAQRGYAVLQPNYRGSSGYGSAYYRKNGFQSWRTAIGDVNDGGRWLVNQGIAAPDKLAIVGWSYGGYAALQSSVLDDGLFKAIVAVAPVTDLERTRAERREFTDYSLVARFIGNGPHVREGSPAQNAAAIRAPVLLFHGDRDQNVGIEQSRFMASRLRQAGKQVELVEFPGLDHQLASSAARTRLLAESDAFLRRWMGMPAN